MAGYDGENSTHDWNTNGFFLRMQERTGLTFTFDQYTSLEKWQAAKDAMFAPGGNLPDVLFKAALTSEEMICYSDSGQLIDLGPLLEENAPNLWALLEANPDWREAASQRKDRGAARHPATGPAERHVDQSGMAGPAGSGGPHGLGQPASGADSVPRP